MRAEELKPGPELDALGKRGGKIQRECRACGTKFITWKCQASRAKYCSLVCATQSARKHPVQEFLGVRYYKDSRGYYCALKTGVKMHRAVWEAHNGKIPSGHLIHHKNGRKDDNQIQNLELVGLAEHTTMHNHEHRRLPIRPKTWCVIGGCGRQAKARRLCTKHYQRHKAAERGYWL